jgi:hypothetical protein
MQCVGRTATHDRCGSVTVPPGAPAWVTQELLRDTITTWQPYYPAPLTADDALEILLSVAHLLDVMGQDR